jgi:hypothetical protein
MICKKTKEVTISEVIGRGTNIHFSSSGMWFYQNLFSRIIMHFSLFYIKYSFRPFLNFVMVFVLLVKFS